RRSPRITELARLRAERENEQQRHREAQLHNNRTLMEIKQKQVVVSICGKQNVVVT
ncbi:hypothetical protein MKW92_048244, partial [Papaver armeniacum]